jgi:tRNA-splicing endonuclease subunit Sen2
MAAAQISPDNDVAASTLPHSTKNRGSHRQALNNLYSLPAPLRTFPLPTFVPHNPLSLFHVLYTWLSQTISPQPSNFHPTYLGWWSPDTRSVHVTDSRSIRGLWEQGFYGKGTLSRSEPNWLDKEKTRRGTKVKITSEEITRKRREDRQQTKWERARKEREAIDQRRSQEAEEAEEDLREDHLANGDTASKNLHLVTDVRSAASQIVLSQGLLSLPNSTPDLAHPLRTVSIEAVLPSLSQQSHYGAPVGPLQLLVLPNSADSLSHTGMTPTNNDNHVEVSEDLLNTNGYINGNANGKTITSLTSNVKSNTDGNLTGLGINGTSAHGSLAVDDGAVDGSINSDDASQTSNFTPNGSALVNGNGSTTPKMRRQKNVRFSPTVEKTTFIQSEPPSPERAMITAPSTGMDEQPLLEELMGEPIQNMEHFQLTMEEAFFLSYGLGVLTILDPETKSQIPNQKLLELFRQSSYFPPTSKPSLSPDDPFMLNYVVYHHYRSLGWVVRGGVKFSCDFMLYNRGPVFSHAEFAILILPSYSDPYWSSDAFLQHYVEKKEHRTWAWMHCINRVITQAKKSLILVYVDIPKPLDGEEDTALGVDGLLKRYQIREFVMKRWQLNRERGSGK